MQIVEIIWPLGRKRLKRVTGSPIAKLIEYPQCIEHAGRIRPKAHTSAHFSEDRRPLMEEKRIPVRYRASAVAIPPMPPPAMIVLRSMKGQSTRQGGVTQVPEAGK
jgi:hypothetical protein